MSFKRRTSGQIVVQESPSATAVMAATSSAGEDDGPKPAISIGEGDDGEVQDVGSEDSEVDSDSDDEVEDTAVMMPADGSGVIESSGEVPTGQDDSSDESESEEGDGIHEPGTSAVGRNPSGLPKEALSRTDSDEEGSQQDHTASDEESADDEEEDDEEDEDDEEEEPYVFGT